jgi:hypothetical protein
MTYQKAILFVIAGKKALTPEKINNSVIASAKRVAISFNIPAFNVRDCFAALAIIT